MFKKVVPTIRSRRDRFPCYDTAIEWRELLCMFPAVEVLSVDLPDVKPLLKVLRTPSDHLICDILPSLSALIIRTGGPGDRDIWHDIARASSQASPSGVGLFTLLINALHMRRQLRAGRVLSSISLVRSEGSPQPFEENEVIALKGGGGVGIGPCMGWPLRQASVRGQRTMTAHHRNSSPQYSSFS